jgi:hypothetical protein
MDGAPDAGARRPAAGRFCEIRRIADQMDVEALTERLVGVLQPDPDARHVLSHVISEALINVCQHSRATGFCAAQLYEKERVVRFCIADWGRGLTSSLGRYSPRDDQHAVELAMTVGVSGPSPAATRLNAPGLGNRGVGLAVARRLVEENGGWFMLWSGTGAYQSASRPQREHVSAWHGTLLAAKVRRDNVTRRLNDILRDVTAELGRVPRQPRRLRPLP